MTAQAAYPFPARVGIALMAAAAVLMLAGFALAVALLGTLVATHAAPIAPAEIATPALVAVPALVALAGLVAYRGLWSRRAKA